MTAIILPGRRIRRDFKPDFPVRLNRAHPLAEYLSALWLPNSINPVDLVTRQSNWTKTGTIGSSISKAGRAIKGNGTDGYLSRDISIPASRQHLLLAVFEATVASNTEKTVYALGDGSQMFGAFALIESGTGSSTAIRAQQRAVTSGTIMSATGPAVSVGSLYVCAWYVQDTVAANNRLWVNGLSYAATGNTEAVGATLTVEAIGALKRAAPSNYSPDHILLVARGIPPLGTDLDAILKKWTMEPWDLLEPEQSRTIVLFPVSSGTTLSASDASAIGAIDTVAITQTHTLSATDAESTGAIDTPALTQTHTLAALDAESTGAVDTGALTQTHHLTASDPVATSEVDTVTLPTGLLLTADDPAAAGTIDTGSVTQTHTLAVSEPAATPAVDAPALTQTHMLSAADPSATGEVDSVSLETGIVLTASDTESTGTIDTGAIVQTHAVTVLSPYVEPEVDVGMLIQHHLLSAADVVATGAIDTINLAGTGLGDIINPSLYRATPRRTLRRI